VETAEHMTLYGALIKSHRVDGALARETVDNHHMTRPEFRDLFSKIFDKPLKDGKRKARRCGKNPRSCASWPVFRKLISGVRWLTS
jgi:hypothetical protein